MIGQNIEQVRIGRADDIVSTNATRALISSLLFGLLFWVIAAVILVN
ncbi:hypothetical protein [Sphingomonas solaris]|nr:hypothetical protein [Sphingomonas solaris]